MVKFVDCKFNGKHELRHELTREIMIACNESIPDYDKLNIFRVENYIHLLIDESHYNPNKKYFHIPDMNVKIPLKVFKNVAIEYILEHKKEFLLNKYS